MIFPELIAIACLVWYFTVLTVCAIGILKIRKDQSREPATSVSNTLPLQNVPHVTIIRPVKGIEPYLYECLAATFHQAYPPERLTIYFCISSRDDPATPTLERLLHDFPSFDAKILVEEEDPNLSGRNGHTTNLGPNPKIRNMSKAYREAKGDIVWIIDCNVWISPLVAGRLVDLLCGFTSTALGQKHKFVHQLPLVVDVSTTRDVKPNSQSPGLKSKLSNFITGGLLEELFLSTSHAKFYTAISTVAIAPCIVGKSNMFRRSHLNALTSSHPTHAPGIDFFSTNICEDHLIGDLLWRSPVPPSVQESANGEGHSPVDPTTLPTSQITWQNHGLLPPHPSNLATQPTSNLSLISYLDRRTRWLRVRKFTVTLATLVEPGTESLLCSLYGAYGLTCLRIFSMPNSWTAFWLIFLTSMVCWATADRYVWTLLQHGGTGDPNERPVFGRAKGARRPIGQWLLAWLGREVLAFPIWMWAFWGGVTVVWRGRRFWVGTDMVVHEMDKKGKGMGIGRVEESLKGD